MCFCCKTEVRVGTKWYLWRCCCCDCCHVFSLSVIVISSILNLFILVSLPHTHTEPQTHMNNVSSEEIAAAWQRGWFWATIQNRERERGANTCISNRGFVVRRESGEEERGWQTMLMFKQQRRRNESAWKHEFSVIFLIFFLHTKGEEVTERLELRR